LTTNGQFSVGGGLGFLPRYAVAVGRGLNRQRERLRFVPSDVKLVWLRHGAK
jgi:hypothetical protein